LRAPPLEADADRLRDHQRRRRGEDETTDAARHGRIAQVQRPLHIGRHEGAILIMLDVRLVQRAAVDDGFNAIVTDSSEDARP